MEYDPRDPLGLRGVCCSDRELLHKYADLEVDFMVDPSYHRKEQFIAIRSTAISDIDKYTDKFEALVPYIAIGFVDRFLSRNMNIPVLLPDQGVEQNVELFAFCCVSIASKTISLDFSLIEFLIEHPVAEVKHVEVMEHQIREGLNHMVRPLTPMTFLYFFLPDKHKTEYEQRQFPTSHESCMIFEIQRDIRFTKFRPSTLAASVILASSYKILPGSHSRYLEKISKISVIHHSEVEECFDELKNHVITPANFPMLESDYPTVFKSCYRVSGIVRQKQSKKEMDVEEQMSS